jgi:dTDP-glucose pyrophosphorylase
MTLTIVMPMAGLGSRFRDAGSTLPKPLLPVLGVPMFRLAAASLTGRFPDARVVCVVLAEHDAAYGLSARLTAELPGAAVAVIPQLTGGSLETCLAAEPLVTDAGAALVVLDCDLTFRAAAYSDALAEMAAGIDDWDGLLLSFRTHEPRYSFAELDGERVLRTAEKVPISDHGLIGAYGFASARLFFRVARTIVAANHRTGGGEFYVSAAYNFMIAEGLMVRAKDVDAYWSVGTPAELATAQGDPGLQHHISMLGLTGEEERS